MSESLPWRYAEDSYYQKGAFSVEFRVSPQQGEADPDDEQQRRALQELLLTLRDESGLKISSFVDVWDPAEDDPDDQPEAPDYVLAEFVIYNKLGVTSLAKLRRFMEQHLKGDVSPRVVLIDPETQERFHCSFFTIRYLFCEFVAHHPPEDWNRLRELMNQEDRGFTELTHERTAQHKGDIQMNTKDKIKLYRRLLRRAKADLRDAAGFDLSAVLIVSQIYDIILQFAYEGEQSGVLPQGAHGRAAYLTEDIWKLMDKLQG